MLPRKYHNTRLSLRRREDGELASILSLSDPRSSRDVERIVVEIAGDKPSPSEWKTAMGIVTRGFVAIVIFPTVQAGIDLFAELAAKEISAQEFRDFRAGRVQ